jgi:hypothetical protein
MPRMCFMLDSSQLLRKHSERLILCEEAIEKSIWKIQGFNPLIRSVLDGGSSAAHNGKPVLGDFSQTEG